MTADCGVVLFFHGNGDCHAGSDAQSRRVPIVFDKEIVSVDSLLGMLITGGDVAQQIL